MADYVPVYDDGDEIPFAASAAVTAGRLVEVTGDYAVAHPAGASDHIVGVALFDCAVGHSVTVHNEGVHRLTASAAIAVGGLVQSAAGGQAAPYVTTGAATLVVGRALTTASAAGGTVDVLFL